ncbi:hypothetical protein DSECCO2_591700 [anaerobic digester metagenome]
MATQSWTPKRAAAKSRRKIEAMRKLFLDVAYIWGDEDNYIVLLVDKALSSLDEMKEAIAEAAERDAS